MAIVIFQFSVIVHIICKHMQVLSIISRDIFLHKLIECLPTSLNLFFEKGGGVYDILCT